MTTFDFESKLELGRRGEDVVYADLIRAGLYVECRRDATGERGDFSPRMHGSGHHISVPDFRTAASGREAHVESKVKQWISHRTLTNRFEHGIDARAYKCYQQTQEQTGLAVLLVVVEMLSPRAAPSPRHIPITEQATLGAWIDDVEWRRYGDMVYTERERLTPDWVALLGRSKRVQLGFLLTEAEAYQAYKNHLDNCRPCRYAASTGGYLCAQGRFLHDDWKRAEKTQA